MACSSLDDCLPENPLEGKGIASNITSLPSFLYLVTNAVFYLIYGALVVYIAFYLVQTIYNLAFGNKAEDATYELIRTGLTKAVVAAVGLILVTGVNFFLVLMLDLLGADGVGIFGTNPFG